MTDSGQSVTDGRIYVGLAQEARVRLLLVDGAGRRQLVDLDRDNGWQLAPTTPGGEPLILTHLELVGVTHIAGEGKSA